jgi:hypothetical protein
MEKQQSTHYFLLLKATLFLQTTHTVLSLIGRMRYFIDSHYDVKFDWNEMIMHFPDWTMRILKNDSFILLVALFIEISLWRWLLKRKAYVWNYYAMMSFAMLLHLYANLALGIQIISNIHHPILNYFYSYLRWPHLWEACIVLLAAIPGLIGLWLCRHEFSVKQKDLWHIIASIIPASMVVYFSGHPGTIEWQIRVPRHMDALLSSKYEFVEAIFVICIGFYLLVQVFSQVFKTRSDET